MGDAKRRRDLGATGDFPRGKLNADDEGGLQIAIGHKDGTVTIDFGKEVAWVGFSPQDAANLAAILIQHAREAARQTGSVVTVNL